MRLWIRGRAGGFLIVDERERLEKIVERVLLDRLYPLRDWDQLHQIQQDQVTLAAAAVIDALVADRERLVAAGARAVDLTNPWGDRITSESAAVAVLDGIGLGVRASSTRKTG